jgi:hypothetical protein
MNDLRLHHHRRKIISALLALTCILILAGVSQAQVKPGDFITMQNASKVRGLVSPGVFYKTNSGRSRFQEDRALRAVRALSAARAGRHPRHRIYPLALRGSQKG